MALSMPQPPPLVMDADTGAVGDMLRISAASRGSRTPRGGVSPRQLQRGSSPATGSHTPRGGGVTPRPLQHGSTSPATSQSAFLTEAPAPAPNFSGKVESCTFPGIDDCGELPRGSKPAPEIMREGAHLVHFASRSHEVQFGRCWASKPCEEMLVAFVWHVICQHFDPDPEAADALFSKLAASYATLHGTTLVTTEAKDAASW